MSRVPPFPLLWLSAATKNCLKDAVWTVLYQNQRFSGYAELLASPQHRAEISDLLRNLEVGQCVFQGPIYIGEDTKPTRAPICVNVSHLEDIASAPLSKSNS